MFVTHCKASVPVIDIVSYTSSIAISSKSILQKVNLCICIETFLILIDLQKVTSRFEIK